MPTVRTTLICLTLCCFPLFVMSDEQEPKQEPVVAAYVERAKARPAYIKAYADQLADYDGQPFTL